MKFGVHYSSKLTPRLTRVINKVDYRNKFIYYSLYNRGYYQAEAGMGLKAFKQYTNIDEGVQR